MDKKKPIMKRLIIFKNKVNNDIPIDKMIFFGSRAVGGWKRDSDVDLIIVSPNFKSMDFFERGAKMYDYWNLEYPVDFLCYTPKEFKRLKKRITIVSGAIKEGVEL